MKKECNWSYKCRDEGINFKHFYQKSKKQHSSTKTCVHFLSIVLDTTTHVHLLLIVLNTMASLYPFFQYLCFFMRSNCYNYFFFKVTLFLSCIFCFAFLVSYLLLSRIYMANSKNWMSPKDLCLGNCSKWTLKLCKI